MTEYRNYSRIPIEVVVELHLNDGSCHYGETSDLSLDGAFIHLPNNAGMALSPGDNCRLILVVTTKQGWVRVEFSASIMHVHKDGIGVRLEVADSSHYESFIKLLLSGTDDVDLLLEELSQNPGEGFQFSAQ